MPNIFKINICDKIKISELIGLKKNGKTVEKYKHGDRSPNTAYENRFIEYGDIDYEAAKVLFNIQDRSYDFMNQAAFLCAQATEKYLKAFLFWNSKKHYPGLPGEKVLEKIKDLQHDLIKILGECIKDNLNFKKFKEQVEVINKYSLLKYPDIEDEMVFSDEGLSISSGILKEVSAIGDFVKGVIKNE